MANEFRDVLNYFFGQLSSAASISDTTLNCADFANLPGGVYGAGRVLPLVLHDPALKVYEIVWVTAHTAAATAVTVTRAKEGTTARAWGAGTQILCAPSVRDGLPVLTRATLPADAHLGARVALSDESVIVERAGAGWGPSVGVAQAADIGPRRSGSVPSTAVPLLRGGHKSGTTGGGTGTLTVSHATPFPNATVATAIGLVDSSVSAVPAVSAETASGVTFQFFKTSDGLPVANGTSVIFQYISMGY